MMLDLSDGARLHYLASGDSKTRPASLAWRALHVAAVGSCDRRA